MSGARVTTVALLAAAALAVAAAPAAARTFAFDASTSKMTVIVGKSGIFSFAGHDHEIAVEELAGEVTLEPGAWSEGRVVVRVPSSSLQVIASAEPRGDAPKVQKAMEEEVLEVARHPDIVFRSTAVEAREDGKGGVRLRISGELELHGVKQEVVLDDVSVLVEGETLRAAGTAKVKQTAFGIDPPSAGGGTVKAKDAVTVGFEIEASAAAGKR